MNPSIAVRSNRAWLRVRPDCWRAPEDVLTELGDDRVLGRLGVALAVGLLVGFRRQYAKQDVGAATRSLEMVS